MIFIDTETCGLHGLPVLIQYAEDDGEIILHEVFQESIQKTLDLIEWFCENDLCFFNAAFDWFHLVKIYTTLSLIEDKDQWPEWIIDEIAEAEEQARDLDICLKPKSCVDLFLYAKKGPFQSLMDRQDIKIKKVPTAIAKFLKDELNKIIVLDPIYFARKKSHEEQWQVDDIHMPNGDMNPAFKNVTLRFAPSTALKTLTTYVLKKEATKFAEIELNKRYNPKEIGWAPYAKSVGSVEDWKWAWPQVIKYHIDHWAYDVAAREYARNDIVFTRELYHFFGEPESDNDSMLACAVAATRWRGFKLDLPKLRKLRESSFNKIGNAPTDPAGAKRYLLTEMDEQEAFNLDEGTGMNILEAIQKWNISCDNCVEGYIVNPKNDCDLCGGTGLDMDMNNCECVSSVPCPSCHEVKHKAAVIATEIITARKAKKEIELFDKLLKAKRFHASFKIIGTLSGRMSGSDKLNPQAIKGTKEVRSCFPLAFENEFLCGGDFAALEVGITAAICKDQGLIDDLTIPVDCCDDPECKACEGKGKFLKKIHGLFAEALYPDLTYNEIIATSKTENDLYLKGKASVFARIYFGEPETIANNAGISIEHAEKACKQFDKNYPGIEGFRDDIIKLFSSMTQPNGIGSAIFWKDCEEYSSSLLGYRRYFTLENDIQNKLFKLAQKPPKEWKNFRVKVTRRDRLQTASGAAQSAIYAAAFNIEASRIRQAGNHVIQSTGAEITKAVQAAIMELQPSGVHPWRVRCLNIHDEVIVVTDSKETIERATEKMNEIVEKYQPVVPLLRMDWSKHLGTWADK
jgi:hypothetical protein